MGVRLEERSVDEEEPEVKGEGDDRDDPTVVELMEPFEIRSSCACTLYRQWWIGQKIRGTVAVIKVIVLSKINVDKKTQIWL